MNGNLVESIVEHDRVVTILVVLLDSVGLVGMVHAMTRVRLRDASANVMVIASGVASTVVVSERKTTITIPTTRLIRRNLDTDCRMESQLGANDCRMYMGVCQWGENQ